MAKTFTGIRRKRETSPAIRLADFMARFVITFGGIGTIVAVLVVCVVIASEALPLFAPARVQDTAVVPQKFVTVPLHLAVDEYQRVGYAIMPDGKLRLFRGDTGALLSEAPLPGLKDGQTITAISVDDRERTGVLGLDDGSMQFFRVKFTTAFRMPANEPALDKLVTEQGVASHSWKARDVDSEGVDIEVTRYGVADRIPTGELRLLSLEWTMEKPRKAAGSAIRLIDHALMPDKRPIVVTFSDDKESPLRLHTSRLVTNNTTGLEEVRFSRPTDVPVKEAWFSEKPSFVRLGSTATNLFLAWPSGRCVRFRHAADEVEFVEMLDVVTGKSATLTAMEFAIGRDTLIVGDSLGGVTGWFTAPFDGHTVGFRVFNHKSEDQNKPHLWVFREDSPALEEFVATGNLQSKVTREKALKGLDVVAPDEMVLAEYVAAVPVDSRKLVQAKTMPTGPAAVTSIAPSMRSRMFVAGYADGTVSIFNLTGATNLLQVKQDAGSVQRVAMLPKDNGMMAATGQGLARWMVDVSHPEASRATMFEPVWYEGYDEPKHMWQATAGEDASEPKLGLMPLIFGTLKATLYSMLIAVPLALMAAVFTSEFLKPSTRARLKPIIEMMASLPSVVLGFLAAIWLAPLVEEYLAGVLAAFIFVPVAFALGAFVWQMLPYRLTVLYREYRFLVMLLISLPAGFLFSIFVAGPAIATVAFDGQLRRYLNGAHEIPRYGSPLLAWILILLPVSLILVAFINGRFIMPMFRVAAFNWTRQQAAIYSLLKFIIGAAVVVVVAFVLALLMTSVFGIESRGKLSVIDTFDQRNALVVGFIMGFAVIPIIYTIAEDALSSVPDHLRAASLGAGATPWQTAMRIIIPTAASGLFSACMIGLGRAVGETMIVLMAAGGTAVMDPNIFNGFRTLSANIATELPEAVQGSTHYRTLFLAGLVLFTMTFVINTLAEAVRQRFRKRAFQL